ncbi:MAG: threonylcarbamoyl-AMP synthase [Methanosarcinales archaeon]|nr:threonylcarbamoyl-AMP synthase [Methanosarcinales archaeon]
MASKAARLIREGGAVVYPTETVYGIGADAFNETAVKRVFEIKQRPLDKPLFVAVSSFEMLEQVAVLGEEDMDILRSLLPGPISFLVQKSPRLPDILTASSPLVGIRFPDHPLALEIIGAAGPITSTSANITGQPSPVRMEDLDQRIARAVDLVVDGGRCKYGQPSTLVDLAARRIVRRGAMIEEAERVIR